MSGHTIQWKDLILSDGAKFLYSLEGSTFLLTNLRALYSYEFPSNVLAKNEELNPSLEFSDEGDVFEEICRILESKTSTKSLKEAIFEVQDDDDEVPFGWTFEMMEKDSDFFYENITKSLFRGLHRLWEDRESLLKVIQDKDVELDALYNEDGASLTRSSLKTKKFNLKALPLASSAELCPFTLLTSKSYMDYLQTSSPIKALPSYRNVEKRLKMTTDNIFDDEEEEDNESVTSSVVTSASSTPASTPRKNNDKIFKKEVVKRKLKKF